MRLVPVNSVQEGSYLAKTIYDNNGRVLLREGVLLNEILIRSIKKIGIFTIYIRDQYSHSIIDDIIEPQLRQSAIKVVKDTFNSFQKHIDSHKNGINPSREKDFQREKEDYLKEIARLSQEIIEELLTRKKILINLVDIKSLDNYTYQHSVNVAVLSLILGMNLKLSKFELYTLCVGAILHDIGKVFIPKEIILKDGKLTPEEYKIVRAHSQMGYEYLKGSHDVSAMARIIALQHHERPNGEGYPENRKGDNIHKLSKIVAIADVYDALTSDRPYRKAMSPNEALEFIMASGGSQFDYDMVRVFSEVIIPYPEGCLVMLNTGEIAAVEENEAKYPLRPVVRIVKSSSPERNGAIVDLRKELSIVIDSMQYEVPN